MNPVPQFSVQVKVYEMKSKIQDGSSTDEKNNLRILAFKHNK